MKVKIGHQIYDSEKQPIMLILTEEEKELIGDMGEQTKFCSFSSSSCIEDIKEFMEVE